MISLELNLMRLLADYQEENKEVALITVISSDSVENCRTGDMLLVDENGKLLAGGIGNQLLQKKAIEQGRASMVIVADDADSQITLSIRSMCEARRIVITHVDSMKELGKACGIEVGAATVAILQS